MTWLICEEIMQPLTLSAPNKLVAGIVLGIIITWLSRLFIFPKPVLTLHRNVPYLIENGVIRSNCSPKLKSENTKYVIPEGKRELILIGVMTANVFLETRARTVYETWGSQIPGKLLFFTPETTNLSTTLPIVALPTVDDTYPPQKKSFLTLKYMYENYGDKFEWFMRADDDVYLRSDKMETFLRNLNSSKRLFIGQAGTGNKDEYGRLNLDYDENFCMGGPGLILSHKALAAVAPNVKHCLQNLLSKHEDTEIGRCVRRFAGIPCTWAYEMQNIFYHNSAGWEAFTGNLKTKEVHRAITLHPLKQYNYLYKLHNYMRAQQIADLQYETIKLERQLQEAKTVLLNLSNGTRSSGLGGAVEGFWPNSEKELVPWDFVSRSWFSLSQTNPRKKMDGAIKEAFDDLVREVMNGLNTHSRERGRIIDFKEIYYAAYRVNPLYCTEYLVDVLLVYKKYRGRKMTVKVRHHNLFQQNFKALEMHEVTRKQSLRKRKRSVFRFGSRKILSFYGGNEKKKRRLSVANVVEQDLDYIKDLEDEYDDVVVGDDGNEISEALNYTRKTSINLSYDTVKDLEFFETEHAPEKVIYFVIPVAGRLNALARFLKNFETVVLKRKDSVEFVLVLYEDPKDNTSKSRTVRLLKRYRLRYKHFRMRILEPSGVFSRGPALEYGAASCPSDALLFLNDIDVLFDDNALFRIRLQTIRNHQIYYPIVFSEYDPSVLYNVSESRNHFAVSETLGYWRAFGYGIVSIYKSDLEAIGGFDKNIVGWGKEDVDLFEKAIKSNLTIFRAADPGLVHVFHRIECDNDLEDSQKVMCTGSKVNTVFSQKFLANYVVSNGTLNNFPYFDKIF